LRSEMRQKTVENPISYAINRALTQSDGGRAG
jgi:hypothetical protein